MFDKLEFLVRFWELKARHAFSGEPLSSEEQIELLSLLTLVSDELALPEPHSVDHSDAALPVQLIGEGTIVRAELRAVSAGSLLLGCPAQIRTGGSIVLRFTDAVRGIDFSVPCKVQWTRQGAPNTVALTVDGIPSRVSFFEDTRRRLNPILKMGPRERLVG